MRLLLSFFFFLFSFWGLMITSAQFNFTVKMYKANRYFSEKKYDEAILFYSDAVKEKPMNFWVHQNLGNSYYRKNNYQNAQLEYQKAIDLAQKKEERYAALYNLGNVFMRKNQYHKALTCYKSAMKINASGKEARKNYQIAKKLASIHISNTEVKSQELLKNNSIPKDKTPIVPKELEHSIFTKLEEREKKIMKRILNERSRSTPRNNEKNW